MATTQFEHVLGLVGHDNIHDARRVFLVDQALKQNKASGFGFGNVSQIVLGPLMLNTNYWEGL